MTHLVDAAVKGTIVLLAAGGLARMLRRKSAAAQSLIWVLSFAALAALPALSLMGPRMAALPWLSAPLAQASARFQASAASLAHAPGQWPWALLWAAGACITFFRLVYGIACCRRIALNARPVTDFSGISGAVNLRESGSIAAPLVFGILRPLILLPAEARQWRPERLRSVIGHERAHIERRDCVVFLLAELTCCVYWFHPLVWIANRRLRNEAERACDDRVLLSGAKASDYAEDLLSIARSSRTMRTLPPTAPAMVRRSGLEDRLVAILDAGRERRALSRHQAVAAFVAAALLILPLGCMQSALAQADKKTYHVGDEGVKPPRVLYKTEPAYTQEARDAQIEGTVVLALEVGTDGLAHELRVERGIDPGLDHNAIEAIEQWKFKPAEKDGEPVAVFARIEVNFRLK